MRAWVLKDGFGLERLSIEERPSPSPGPGQVKLRIRAASLNHRDLSMIRGTYNPRQKLPLVPLSDGAGEVVEVGPGVSRLAPGDRVVSHFIQGWLAGRVPREGVHRTTLGGPLDGVLAEEVVLPAEGVLRFPAHLSFEEASTLPIAALTAWSALISHGRLAAGETVLVQGTGGVSIFALQFARLHGARVLITSSSDEKLARARALGADVGINYRRTPEWGAEVRRLTGGVGVDHVVEVGGAGTLAQSLRAVATGGTVSVIGVLSGGASELAVTPVLMHNLRLQGIFTGSREMFEAMNRALELHPALRPVIDRVFALEEGRAALEHLASGSHVGKVVIRLD
jgi:NADPH:quinone reductase-like Zn-dependent oxidoreductase